MTTELLDRIQRVLGENCPADDRKRIVANGETLRVSMLTLDSVQREIATTGLQRQVATIDARASAHAKMVADMEGAWRTPADDASAAPVVTPVTTPRTSVADAREAAHARMVQAMRDGWRTPV